MELDHCARRSPRRQRRARNFSDGRSLSFPTFVNARKPTRSIHACWWVRFAHLAANRSGCIATSLYLDMECVCISESAQSIMPGIDRLFARRQIMRVSMTLQRRWQPRSDDPLSPKVSTLRNCRGSGNYAQSNSPLLQTSARTSPGRFVLNNVRQVLQVNPVAHVIINKALHIPGDKIRTTLHACDTSVSQVEGSHACKTKG